MKELYKGSDSVSKILSRKPAEGKYRLSGFAFMAEDGEIFRIKHTMSGKVYGLTKDEYDFVASAKECLLSSEQIREKGLETLIRDRFLVEESYDEIKHYKDVLFILRTMQKKKNGLSKFTILPTTGCNARCVYCFEMGFKPETMTYETAGHLVDYILANKCDSKIKLEWFGGEPFVAKDIISFVCSKLKEKGVEFHSAIVTNGSLMTPEVIREAVDVWNLKSAQVSLDGKREYYEARKNYVDKTKYTYDLVLENTVNLAKAGVKISLRCNMNDENISDIDEFIEDLDKHFGGFKNVHMYLAPLHQEMKKESILSLTGKINDTYKHIVEIGKAHLISKIGVPKGFKINYCLGDSMENVVIVMPDGSFTNCENLPDGRNFGNVRDGITDMVLYKKLKAEMEIDEMCSGCPFLPECTSYRKKQCPVTNAFCRECKELETRFELLNLAVNEEDEDEDSGDPC